MVHPLHFPWVVHNGSVTTHLLVYNPFTDRVRSIRPLLRSDRRLARLRYRVLMYNPVGEILAQTSTAVLDPLQCQLVEVARLLPISIARFLGRACIEYDLDDDAFAPRAARYLQARANILAGLTCVVTDHGQQAPAPTETVIWGDVALDETTDTAFFIAYVRPHVDDPVQATFTLHCDTHVSVIHETQLEPKMSSVLLLSHMLADGAVAKAAAVRVTQSIPGRLLGYHFKLDRALVRACLA